MQLFAKEFDGILGVELDFVSRYNFMLYKSGGVMVSWHTEYAKPNLEFRCTEV